MRDSEEARRRLWAVAADWESPLESRFKNQRQFLNFDPLSFRQSGSVPALFFMRAAANADADAITG